MSADDLRLEVPAEVPVRRNWLRTVVLMVLPLALIWAIAFWITGLLWWDAGEAVAQVPPPEPPQIESIAADGVNLERYTAAHPQWRP